jgi:hypothetical protein
MATLDFSVLRAGFDGITASYGATLEEACVVCLHEQGHAPGVALAMKGQFTDPIGLQWDLEYTDQMKRTWMDEPYATEHGAYGIAVLLTLNLTEFTVVERARKGTGVDFWLGFQDAPDDNPFERAARLEVSGQRRKNASEFKQRVKEKKAQTHPTDDGSTPAYIAVIEFETPQAHVEKK